MRDEVLKYIIEAEDRASKTFKQVGKNVSGLGAKAKGLAAGLGRLKIPLIAAGAAAGALGLKMVHSAGQLEQTSVAFETLLGSAEAARKEMDMIKREAAATPFQQSDLMNYNIQLISAGENAKNAMDVIKGLGDAVAIAGKGAPEMRRMVDNLQQIKLVGKAAERDMRQFGNAGIPIWKALSMSTGKSIDQLQKMTITYDMLTEAIKKASSEGGMWHGGMEKQSQTLLGRWSTFKDNIDILMSTLGEKLLPIVGQLLDHVSWFVGELNKLASGQGSQFFTDLYEKIKPVADFLQTQFTPIIEDLKKQWQDMSPELQQLGEMVLPGVIAALQALGLIIVTIIGLVTALVAGFAHAAEYFVQWMSGFIELWAGMWEVIKGIFTGNKEMILHGMQTMWEGIKDIFVGGIMAVVKFIEGFVKALINWFKTLYNILVGHSIIPDMVKAIVKWFTTLKDKTIGVVSRMLTRITSLVKQISSSVTSTISGMVNKVGELGSRLYHNLVSPFESAWGRIKDIANRIRHEIADAFNMDKRNSPSINDRLRELKQGMQQALKVEVPNFSSEIAGQMAGVTQNITFNNNINSELDIAKVNWQLGLALETRGRF